MNSVSGTTSPWSYRIPVILGSSVSPAASRVVPFVSSTCASEVPTIHSFTSDQPCPQHFEHFES